MIVKSKTASNYTVLPNQILEQVTNTTAIAIMAYLLSKPHNWVIYKSHLYNHFDDGRQRIDAAFKILEQMGYISGVRIIENGRFSGWQWIVYDTPWGGQERTPIVGKQIVEKPIVGKPTVEKQTTNKYYNTLSKEEVNKEERKSNDVSIGQGSKTLKHQKEKRNTSARVSLDLSAVAAPLLDIVKEWIEYRKEIRKPMNIQRSFDAWYKKLCDYSKNDPKKARQIIDTSISNGWTGIFEPKDNNQSGYRKEEPIAPLSPLFNLKDVLSTNLNKAPEER